MGKKMNAEKKKDLLDPKQFYNLYENEYESDVTLLVGHEGCQERIPAHSWVLASGSDYFRACLEGPFANSPSRIHRFEDDPKGFNNLIRWLYQNKCNLQSLQSSLDTLIVAIKYLCPDLADRCIIQLTTQLSANNVLEVLRWIHVYCPPYRPPSPSAPPLEDLEERESQLEGTGASQFRDPTLSCHRFLMECLDLIDKHSDGVLISEYLPNTDAAVLQMVLKRDTLSLSSELKVLKALHEWSTANCKRKHLPLTLANRRKVLGPLLFLARLLTLSVPEVETLAMKHSKGQCLLTQQELEFVDASVRRLPLPAVPESMKDHVQAMSAPRIKRDGSGSHETLLDQKRKRKSGFRKKFNFNKKEIILDLVSILGLIFD